jgi:hypothetical protein
MSSLTFAQALAGHERLIVWWKGCGYRSEPDVAIQVTAPGCRFLLGARPLALHTSVLISETWHNRAGAARPRRRGD